MIQMYRTHSGVAGSDIPPHTDYPQLADANHGKVIDDKGIRCTSYNDS